MAEARFLAPLDVLFLRGNRLFGEAGQHGEAQMPPWPSVAAGAIRSRMLVDHGINLSRFTNGEKPDGRLGEVLGTPTEPGSFRLAWFSLARRNGVGVEPIIPQPADVVADGDNDNLLYLKPQPISQSLQASRSTPQLAVLKQVKTTKPEGGLWLVGDGLASYLHGEEPLQKHKHTIARSKLWETDPRLGIALDPTNRTAQEGRLYTTEGIAPHKDIGFLVVISGADELIPKHGLIRIGGDGRGARIESCQTGLAEPDWERIGREKRFRLILTTPGLFENGWRLPGLEENGLWTGPGGARATLVSAAVPRAQVVSGWDLARWKPKAALRAAPAGSVYWFEASNADGPLLRRELQKLVSDGFGCYSTYPDKTRIAEGFNNVMVANWTVT